MKRLFTLLCCLIISLTTEAKTFYHVAKVLNGHKSKTTHINKAEIEISSSSVQIEWHDSYDQYRYSKTDENGNRHYNWVDPNPYNFGLSKKCVVSADGTRVNVITSVSGSPYPPTVNVFDVNPPEIPQEEAYIMY